jgi:hypothetical protein
MLYVRHVRRLYYGCVVGKWVSWVNRFLFKAEKNAVRSFVRQNKDEKNISKLLDKKFNLSLPLVLEKILELNT